MIDTNQIMSEVMIDNTVETIARMDLKQRDLFIEVLSDKWPELANKLSISIEANLLEKDSNYDY
tara:strand:+ start:162 stop:353 length:192 start_codon:yes stop_codon:yes gene_type:complete